MAWTTAHPPPSPGRGQVRINYVTQAGVRPPTFIFFTNRPERFPVPYERYLTNRLRDSFGFIGSPLRLKFRSKRGKGKSAE